MPAHVTPFKLFDDTKKGYEYVLADVTAHHDAHRARFIGKAVRLARWLETDLGPRARHPDREGATSPVLASILDSSAVQRLATPGAKARSQPVYPQRDPRTSQGPATAGERMPGMVESVTGRGFDDFDRDVTLATRPP
ncbi:hypothetical protein [Pedococcus sp. P5_B7]